MSISPPNSDAAYRVGRLKGGPADTQISPKLPSATSTWNIFQLSRQSTQLTENTQDIPGSLSTVKYIIDSSIPDILAEALAKLRDAMGSSTRSSLIVPV